MKKSEIKAQKTAEKARLKALEGTDKKLTGVEKEEMADLKASI